MNDDWFRPLKLSRECRKVLDRLGKPGAKPTVLFGQEQKTCEQALRRFVDPLIEVAGLPLNAERRSSSANRVDQYHWFLRELSRLYRSKYSRDLAFCIELTMRKWQGFGLSPEVMSFLVVTIDRELRVLAGETDPEAQHKSEGDCALSDRDCPRSVPDHEDTS